MKTNDGPSKTSSGIPLQTGFGFTLVELLMVIAIIAVLAGLLLPVLTKGKSATQSLACMNNLKQLHQGWAMYPDDHNGELPPNKLNLQSWNFDSICPEGFENANGSWVLGNATKDVNTWGVKNGVLFQYNPSAAIYHCPSDKSKVDNHPNVVRNRSYAMSYFMNGDKYLLGEYFPLVKEKYSQVANDSPGNLFVFIDEAEQAIQDGVFFLHYPRDNGEREARAAHWMDIPGDRHHRGCNITFADGHAMRLPWKWTKKNAIVDQAPKNSLDFQDLRTLQQFMPEKP